MEGKFEIADLSPDEVRAIERAEEAVKAETGRDIILIAWDNSLASGQSADNKAEKS